MTIALIILRSPLPKYDENWYEHLAGSAPAQRHSFYIEYGSSEAVTDRIAINSTLR